jgi:hypothetical protein
MAPFLYRCPATGRQVQGFSATDLPEGSEEYEAVTCLACAQIHFVNPGTGKVLGGEDE